MGDAQGFDITPVGVSFFNFRDGISPRDAEAHLIARVTLLHLLEDDQRVQELFESFGGL